ncbi:MAG: TlpA family protein disulfide reductase [Cellvibrionales bacterium TMED47]|nr:thioredoxin [Porticoccaceae bacterium]RPG83268.1 MAG: TlpA family protein disulfide reductase [Cellvibrionales bacterium TMED47]
MIRIIYLVSFLLISCSGEHSSNEHSQFLLTNSETVNLMSPSKVIVINYWATWCAPCRKEIPELNELDHQLSDRLDVIGVNFDGVVGEQLDQQMAKLGIEFDNLYIDPRHIWGLDAVTVLPETLIINGQGQLMHRLIGPQTKSSLETLINAL